MPALAQLSLPNLTSSGPSNPAVVSEIDGIVSYGGPTIYASNDDVQPEPEPTSKIFSFSFGSSHFSIIFTVVGWLFDCP